MFELSYTKIRSYLNCAWLYKLKFIDDWKAPPFPEASLGISVHKALELYHARMFSDEACLIDCLDEAWERAGYKNSGQELEFYDKAKEILKTYFREIARKWPGEVLEVEKNFSFNLKEAPIRLMGTVDRLDKLPDGSYALIEYKTHSAVWDVKQLSQDLQVTLYAQGMSQGLSLAPVKIFFFFVTQGFWVEVARGDKDWNMAAQTIQEVASSIASGKFEPDIKYCPSCDMNQVCVYSTIRKK